MFAIGDKVICIWPGNDAGPDCIVGNIFIIKGIRDRDGLVFACHPYMGIDRRIAVAAYAHRFVKYEEQGATNNRFNQKQCRIGMQ